MKVSFNTFGCRLNQYDSEWLREEFELIEPSHKLWDTNVCVINTCAVTGRVCREARNAIRTEAKKYPKPFIIVTGCYAKVSPDEILQIEGIDLIEPDPKKIVKEFLRLPVQKWIKNFYHRDKAFVKIQEGCDQFCSYCIVPYARGKPQDRLLDEILNEVKALIQNGYEEFILTGTNVGKHKNLLKIIEMVDEIPGVKRVGIGSIEPIGISDEMLDFIKSSNKFARYFHIPLQSGDNNILKLMNRWYTAEEYIKLVYKVKEKMPDCTVGADVIVGFPGEGECEFLNTYNLITNSPISRLHIFRYSKRPGTAAENLKGEPPEIVKKERSAILHKLSDSKWANFRAQFIGKILECHIERVKPTSNGLLIGVTKNYIKVLFNPMSPVTTDNFVNLMIKNIEGQLTYGEVIRI